MPVPEQTSEAFTISVVTPVHGRGDTLRACMEGVRGQNLPADEVIVVANGASDAALDIAREFADKVIIEEQTLGPAAARNRGVEKSNGTILLFIDADVIPHPDVTEKVVSIFHQYPDLSAIIGSYDDDPGRADFMSRYRNLLHHYVHQTSNEEAATFWGACGTIRREAFLEVGGFDEINFADCIEDIDLGYRLRQAGHQIRLQKDLQVKHLKHWDLRTLLYTDIFHRALPWSRLLLEHPEYMNDLNVNRKERTSAMLLAVMLGSLLLSVMLPCLFIFTLLSAGGLLWLNAPLYRFFYRQHGLSFMLRSIAAHWMYYLYSILSFGVAWLQHQMRRRADSL